MKANSHPTRIFDKAGMAISFLCLLHCIALPLLMALLPWMSTSLGEDEGVHKACAAFVLPIGLMALASGYRQHRQGWIFCWGMAGLVCVGAAAVAGHQLGESLEHSLSVLGSIQVVLAHYLNLRYQRECCAH